MKSTYNSRYRPFFLLSIFISLLLAGGCKKNAAIVDSIKDEYGEYALFIPPSPQKVLVLMHGYPWPDDSRTSEQLRSHTLNYVNEWRAFAEKNQMILLVPQMGSGDFAGYRRLFGKIIDPGDYIIQLADLYGEKYIKNYEQKFIIYGHSAGGQFAVRFAVCNADKLYGAIISAPSTYPFPDETIAWPYGFKPILRDSLFNGVQDIKLDKEKSAGMTFQPQLGQAVEAVSSLPIHIFVGSIDTMQRSAKEGHIGNNRLTRAQDWMKAMNHLAGENQGKIKMMIVENVAHDSFKMLEDVQKSIVKF